MYERTPCRSPLHPPPWHHISGRLVAAHLVCSQQHRVWRLEDGRVGHQTCRPAIHMQRYYSYLYSYCSRSTWGAAPTQLCASGCYTVLSSSFFLHDFSCLCQKVMLGRCALCRLRKTTPPGDRKEESLMSKPTTVPTDKPRKIYWKGHWEDW